jgi:chromosomal replication initiator protein
VVARYFSLTQAALRSPTRRKSLVHARSIVIHLARKLTDLSYAQIGQGLGRRDHSTIMHAHRNIQKLLTNDHATQQAIDQLQRILTAV